MEKHKSIVFTDRSANSVDILFKDIRKYDVLSDEDLNDLLDRMSNGDKQAREILINSNLRLVVNKAKQYAWCGMAQEDLFQVGFVGLVEAVNRFDASKCTSKCASFRAYALQWVDCELRKATKEFTRNTPMASIDDQAFLGEDCDVTLVDMMSSDSKGHADWGIRCEEVWQEMLDKVEQAFCKKDAALWEDYLEKDEMGYTMTDLARSHHMKVEFAERKIEAIRKMLKEAYQDRIASRPLLYHRMAS